MNYQKLTKKTIIGMLQENTGSHFLDSGGAYGRHWEKNQLKDYDKESGGLLKFDPEYGEISFTKSLYHFLIDNLTYDPVLQAKFDLFIETMPDDSWPDIMNAFAKTIADKGLTDGYGMENTCNGECLLSQVIQYTYVETEDGHYVILQIHNGCDVRGGYTAPKVFCCEDHYLFNNAQGTIACTNGHNWFTDDSCHWADDGCYGVGAGMQLENYRLIEYPIEDINRVKDIIKQLPKAIKSQTNLFKEQSNGSDLINDLPDNIKELAKQYITDGDILAVSDGVGYCPKCGETLEGY